MRAIDRVGVATVAAIVLVGTAGLALPAAAHPVSDHCYQPPDGWQQDPIDDCSTQAPTPSISTEYDAPPVEGPGDPDGEGNLFPYLFRAVIVRQCTPDNVAGEELPRECLQSGGTAWDACDSTSHWNLGGNPARDVPCSWARDSADPHPVGDDLPFDHLAVSIDCLTCVLDRKVPYLVATDSGDGDSLYGEGGQDGTEDNARNCDWVLWELTICEDPSVPGPRELAVAGCGDRSGITRPAGDEYGTGDGVWQQALSEEEYLTHHLDDGKNEVRDHPGVEGFAVFLTGPVSGRDACPQDSVYTTLQGTITVTAS